MYNLTYSFFLPSTYPMYQYKLANCVMTDALNTFYVLFCD
jgi:hypothetical protein